MRGKTKKAKTLAINGKSYLQSYGEDAEAKIGDILLGPQIENKNNIIIDEDLYHQTGNKGYFRAHVFDGRGWCNLNSNEIFPEKENHFNKSELAIDVAGICAELITAIAGVTLYRTYRDHYTIHQYVPGEFKGKKGHYGKR